MSLSEKLKQSGDIPQPRFGHTITLISNTQAVLFGGAIGDTGKYTITGETYLFDLEKYKWTKMSPNGIGPKNRAAHCSLCIDNLQMVVFGGAVGGGGLADDNLYALDLTKGEQSATWLQISVVGNTPGRRYGHAMVYIKPYLLVNGGNTGAEPVSDVWCLNLEKSPYNWLKLECGEQPPVRVYHSAALCSKGSANGMMVIFGGRTADQNALNDTWGLRRHRDGRWDWVRAPYKQSGEIPSHRYQHSTLFLGSLMFVLGGRSNQVGEVLPFEIYDTESSDWYKFQAVQRFRHTLWCLNDFLYIHGGFDQDSPNIPTESMMRIDLSNLFQPYPVLMKQLGYNSYKGYKQPSQPDNSRPNTNPGGDMEIEGHQRIYYTQHNKQNSNQIRLAHQADVATTDYVKEDGDIFKKVYIDKLQEERKKLGTGYQEPPINSKQVKNDEIAQIFIDQLMQPTDFFRHSSKHSLLQNIQKDQIIKLLDAASQIFMREPMVIKINAPVKIFGNINGQFGDLMKMFTHCGSPVDIPECKHDIDGIDYVFLGNYVNKGTRSVETILLLLAIKLKYPEQFHMLRGNQEDKKMTKIFGLGDECAEKFYEDISDPNSIFARLNRIFDYMPLAVLVEERILCVHGGIGQQIRSVEEIDRITRPLEIIHDPKMYEHKIPLDLLWSDPVLNENEMENQPNNEHDIFKLNHVKRFGFHRVNKFINENGLSMIIRSNEPVKDGFEQMQNSIITVFSCTDYGGTNQNAAGILYIKKNGEIQPKVINSSMGNYNVEDRWLNLEESLKRRQNYSKYNQDDIEELKLRQRPPTPERGINRTNNSTSSFNITQNNNNQIQNNGQNGINLNNHMSNIKI